MRREIDERRKALGYKEPIPWAGKHLEASQELEALAAEQPAHAEHALDAWGADEGQRSFKHLPSGLVMHWPRYTAGPKQQQHAHQQQLRRAQRDLKYYQDLALEGGQPVPMSLAEVEPPYLEKMRDKYPGLDLSQVRSRPRVVAAKAKPEQRSNGTLGNVADDPELAKYQANPEF